MRNFTSSNILLVADIASDLEECFKEAIEICANEWKCVVFEVDGKTYSVHPQNLRNAIEREKQT